MIEIKISRSKQFKKDFRNYINKMSDKHFESLIEGFITPPINKVHSKLHILLPYVEKS